MTFPPNVMETELEKLRMALETDDETEEEMDEELEKQRAELEERLFKTPIGVPMPGEFAPSLEKLQRLARIRSRVFSLNKKTCNPPTSWHFPYAQAVDQIKGEMIQSVIQEELEEAKRQEQAARTLLGKATPKVDCFDIQVTPFERVELFKRKHNFLGYKNILQKDAIFKFRVLKVVNPDSIFLEYLTPRSETGDGWDLGPDENGAMKPLFWRELQDLYSKPEIQEKYHLVNTPMANRMYVCYFDWVWERVIVLRILGSVRRAAAIFIDTGRFEWIEFERMFEMVPGKEALLDPPARAFQAKLWLGDLDGRAEHLRPWNPEFCTNLQQKLLNKTVTVFVRDFSTEPLAEMPGDPDRQDVPRYKISVLMFLDADNAYPEGEEWGELVKPASSVQEDLFGREVIFPVPKNAVARRRY